MHITLLLVAVALAVGPWRALAADSVPPPLEPYHIPRMDAFPVDGDAGKWSAGGDQGFRVETLGEPGAHRASDQNAAPSMQIAWTPRGLAVRVQVHDTTPTQAPPPAPPDAKASNALLHTDKDVVELTLSDSANPRQIVQFVIAPSRDAAQPAARFKINDLRFDKTKPDPLTVDAVSAVTADGYIIEALLPWSNLAIKPGAGVCIGLQVNVIDAVAPAQRNVYCWGTNENPYLSARHPQLQLAEDASPPVTIALTGEYQAFRRYRVRINTASPHSQKIALVDQGGRELGATVITGTRGQIDLLFPDAKGFGPLNVLVEGKVAAQFVPAAPPSRQLALDELRIRAASYILVGEDLPAVEVENPVAAEDLLGHYAITTRYFDASLNEVARAAKPGRYAAVTHLAGDYGLSADRISVLYRLPKGRHRREGLVLTAPEVALAENLGINPAVVARQSGALLDLVQRAVFDDAQHGEPAAIVLAGLAETPPDAPPYVERTNPWAMNGSYTYNLKKKLGLPTAYKYVEFLPTDYATAPDKKYPLVIHLHGAGERGDDLSAVRNFGLNVYLASHPEFPAVVISPQCPHLGWWHPLQLNDLIDEAVAKYRIDRARIYMTGPSMGGFGTWTYAMWYPERLAAIVPICSIGDAQDMARLKDIPTWAFHGDADTSVVLKYAQQSIDALKAAGGNVQFTIYPGVGHDSWTQTYANPELYTWMFAHSRRALRP